ncbi:ATP-dependent sacrificial sulfur transferase LarE [Candidatus Endomicrobiellum devescovinae]|jgi:uncharacterized protein|uniref:ATP-dependent sacrificial sulfur transferase LarE n=1 Tax=Candidatus Endomicrobiellum devescovinae TaxID=3242322 RepID=UPI002824CFDF|nr:ATP-dependent sacrificial sulfur transferase LarE [Endomicrobium sp.]
MNAKQKYEVLKKYILDLENLVIAFSGGVDSTFLLKTAHDLLGEKVIAVTAKSCSFPQRELSEAVAFCKKEGITHIICNSEELDIEGFSHNPTNRCYLCKKELFSKIWNIAKKKRINNVAEASNIDDNNDYRPGFIAVSELNVKSPLRYANLTKDEIRMLSKKLGLFTWDKQSFACLSSRFPYGQEITHKALSMVDKAEQMLINMGLKQVRVRHHNNLARIETDEAGFEILMDKNKRKKIYKKLKDLGYVYVSVDLLGYRTGSMNETLDI